VIVLKWENKRRALDVKCLDWQQANPARERRNGRQKIVYSLAREEEMGGRR